MTTFELIRNPAYAGQAPRELEAACHDGSPFLTVRCACGYELHLHETQLELPTYGRDTVIVTRCHACDRTIELGLAELRDAFATMRAEGWTA